ncbi:MAG TPA: LacI family DNA-binding transcriptional regulator, partial [Chitinophagaceae bacterium]|nr:LacI family DNA-binding transcriptional regulator [Chitinophagaceae bacterium]
MPFIMFEDNKKSNAITIKDIAVALHLSTATVSRALRDSYQISIETKTRVKEYAEQHNYAPNLIAQSLRLHKSKSIGVLLCSIPNHFFSQVISGIESAAIVNNYHVIITQSHESIDREKQNLQFLSKRNVDGFLVSISTETNTYDHFKEIIDKNIPIVFFDRIAEINNTHKVRSRNLEAAYEATKHLIANGFKK